MTRRQAIDFYLFTVDVAMAGEARKAGVSAVVVDWEWRGKCDRQRGFDTEINDDGELHLSELSRSDSPDRCCRINHSGEWTPAEIERAIANGATELLLPMVETAAEVEAFLRLVDGRVRAGILVETVAACEGAGELATLPLHAVYVGLHDLSLQRRDPRVFMPVYDGTIDRLREAFAATRFGFAGLTVVDGGAPIPCRLLLAEMMRLDCHFSFLRRSFKRDIVGRDMATELELLRVACRLLHDRSEREVSGDRDEFCRTVRAEYGLETA